MRLAVIAVLALAGCPPVDKEGSGKFSATPEPPIGWADVWGQAPWDPLEVGLSNGVVATPVVLDSDGEEHAYAPLLGRTGEYVSVEEGATAWAPEAELAPGDYTIASSVETRSWNGDDAFEVLPYGVSADFDAANVVGRTYQLLGATVVEPSGLSTLASSLGADVYFEILSVEGESARFRIVYDDGADRPCDFLRATGTLSSTGRLSWSEPLIEAATDPNPMHLENLTLELGFLPDGSAIGGARGTGTADVRDIVDEEGDIVVCDTVASFGTACWDCVGDGSATCATIVFHAGTLQPIDGAYADDLPSCGLDTEQAGEALSCEWDGDLCAFSTLVPFLTLAAARRRKRKL